MKRFSAFVAVLVMSCALIGADVAPVWAEVMTEVATAEVAATTSTVSADDAAASAEAASAVTDEAAEALSEEADAANAELADDAATTPDAPASDAATSSAAVADAVALDSADATADMPESTSAVAAKIAELKAKGGDASEVIASGLASAEEAEAYLEGLTDEQAAYISIDAEMQADGTVIYGVTVYGYSLWELDSEDADNGVEATALDDVTGEDELSLQASSLQSTLEAGWGNLSERINVSGFNITTSTVARTYFEACANAPDYFNVRTKYSYSYVPSTGSVAAILPAYLTTSTSTYNAMKTKYEAKVSEALSALSTCNTDLAKVYLLHDWICSNVSYNNSAAASSASADLYPNAFTAYGAMVDGSAVCQGYSLALCDLLERAGITNKVLLVRTSNHAWNMVVVDGNWYHVDATWDDRGSTISRSWFMKSDSGIKATDSTHQNWQSSSNYNWTSSMVASNTKYDNYSWGSYSPNSTSEGGSSHDFGSWATTAATCTKAGKKTRTCSRCGYTETQTIAALGHSYGGWTTTAATCTKAGSKTRTCTRCGNKDTQTIAALGHSWGAWQTTKAATYKATGSKQRTCSRCGTKETQTIAKLASQVMYRLYNPNSGEHFYTSSTKERDSLKKSGWRHEGVGWTAPTSATSKTPVYRLYSGTDHHYTTSASERDSLRRAGWKYEGIGWYSDDSKGVPLYRQFNPNVQPTAPRNNSGSHNYTTSKKENDQLVSVGWRGEGIGWYGVK